MKLDIKNNKKLIKWIYFIPIVAIVLTTLSIAFIFIYKEKQVYARDLQILKTKILKIKELEAKDRIDKLVEQIEINKNIIFDSSKENVKHMVDFAYKIIQKIYMQNRYLSRDEIVKKIKDRLRDIRFFDNLTGYFYMYYLDGTCLLLPPNPSLEGKNLLSVKDAKGTFIIKKAIKELKKSDKVFDSWYWYRPGSKVMEKKIGYFRSFRPLGVYIGSAFYVNDALKKAKKIALKIIRNYKYDENGYIFAYDYNGVTLNHIRKDLIGKNRINLVVNNRHIVKEMIRGAQINPDGFFINYISVYNPSKNKTSRKISYIKSIKDFKWIVGTGFYKYTIKDIVNSQYSYLQDELKRTIKNIIAISLVMILILSILMILISKRVKNIIIKYERDILKQYKEIIEQRKVFKLLFEKSKDAILLTNKRKIIDANEAALKLLGFESEKEFLRYNILDLSPKYQPDGKTSREKNEEIMSIITKTGAYRGEWLAKKKDGQTVWLEVVITAIHLENEVILHTVARDISKRKKTEKQLRENEAKLAYRARHDILTGLPNRYMFSEIITMEILRAKRDNSKIAVFFMDLDGFKDINDYYGHDIGDEVLKRVAKRVKEELRESDYLFRFGGDEFVLLIPSLKNESDVANIAQKIHNVFLTPFNIRDHFIKLGLSIGISIYPDDGINSDELIRNADISMYKAKEKGKNRYVFYEDDMYQNILKQHELEEKIRKGIINDEFVLYYQPQIDAVNHKIVGLEALVRWEKGGKIVSPAEFLPVAEQCNLINEIGEVVIDKAFKFAKKIKDLNFKVDRVAINLADKQLKNPNLMEIIESYLKMNGCDAKQIEMEITEGFVMDDVKKSSNLLKRLRDIGFSVSIDDFGTGYSSLAYLKKLPFDVIKIDQSFIRDIPGFNEDEAIVNTIIELAKGLNLKIVAEGVETNPQKEFILQRGCSIIQGYLYSKPLPEDKIVTFIKNF